MTPGAINADKLLPGTAPVEVLPDDVKKALGEQNVQVEVYPLHQLIAVRYRRNLSIRKELLVVPFSFVDMLFHSRLSVLIAQETGGGVVPANAPTPAPAPGTTH